MSIRASFLIAAVAAGVLLQASTGLHADDRKEGDHDRARELFEDGEIHSLREILRSIAGELDGDVVGIDLIQINERWVYRVQIVDRGGRRTLVEVDAAAEVDLEGDEEDHD